MSRKLTHETTFQIGETSVLLKVDFGFIPYQPARGPSYACGGEPACPAEVDINNIEWSLDNPITKTIQWHTIDGAMFDLISADDELYSELCQAAADNEADAREAAAEARYEMQREGRA